MRTLLATVVALVCVDPGPAQIFKAEGTLSVYASAGTSYDSKSGRLTESIRAYALSSVPFCQASATASGRVGPLEAGASLSASTSPFCPASAGASADITVTLRAGAPTGGVLRVSGFGNTVVTFAGRDDYVFAVRDYHVCVGQAGLQFRVRCSVRGGSASTSVKFDPSPGAVSPYGSRCPTELQGAWFRTWTDDVFRFITSGAPQTPFSFLVFGTQRLAIPLPPTNCMLLTNFPVVTPIQTVGGSHAVSWLAPHMPGFTFHAQVLGVERLTPSILWRTSNAILFKVP